MTSKTRAPADPDPGEQRRSKRARRSAPLDSPTDALAMDLGSLPIGPDAPGLGRRALIDRGEYIRLVEQSLASLGFGDVARRLEQRSGVVRQSAATNALQAHVLGGDWDRALLAVGDEGLPPPAAAAARFELLQQKFEELVGAGDRLAAVACLRNDLAPLKVDVERLHALSQRLGNSEAAVVDVGDGRRRVLRALQGLLPPGALLPEGRLEELVEQALRAQVARAPLHNTSTPRVSLLADYAAGRDQLPLTCVQVLEGHTSEVWHLVFSHSGAALATCGRDCRVILWDVGGSESDEKGTIDVNKDVEAMEGVVEGDRGSASAPKRPSSGNGRDSSGGAGRHRVRLRKILVGHTAPVLFLAWSPDDSMLASCGQDSAVRVWSTGPAPRCLRVLRHHMEPVLSTAWLPDGRALVTAGQDRLVAVVGAADGEVIQSWRAHRMQDVVVTAGGRHILASTHDRRVNVYEAVSRPRDVERHETATATAGPAALAAPASPSPEEGEWLFSGKFNPSTQRDTTFLDGEDLMAFSLSPCGRYLLANLRDRSLSLWDLGRRAGDSGRVVDPPPHPLARFRPPGTAEGELGRFVVRSCLGGVGGKFVATGTESGKVPVWQRDTGELLAVLEGHTATVNAVAWGPARPEVMATASDDGTVRIWVAEAELEGREGRKLEGA